MRNVLLIISLFIGSNLYAQFGLISSEILNDVKDKKFLVELKSQNDEFVSEMTAQSKEEFFEYVETYNKAIQEILPHRLELSNGDIEFKTPEEIEQISNEDLKNYILFQSGWLKKSSQVQGEFLMYSFNLDYFNAKGKRVKIFEIAYIPDNLIINADIVFITKVLNNHIRASKVNKKYSDSFDVEKNISLLNGKTLLLDDQLTKLTLDEAKEKYESKIEIVDPERIAAEIEKESEDFVFIKMIWSNTKNMAMYDAFDTKECNIVSCIGTGGMKVDFARKHKKYTSLHGQSNFWDPSDRSSRRNPYAGKDMYRINIYKSELSIKKVHLKTMFGKSAQKLNCK